MIKDKLEMFPFMIGRMMISEFEFYLTGSRKFKKAMIKAETDWDFFIKFSAEVVDWLEKEGFVKLDSYCPEGSMHPWDNNTVTVYRFRASMNPNVCPQVDVQLVLDVEKKKWAQFMGYSELSKVSKENAPLVWELLYRWYNNIQMTKGGTP